MKKWFTIVAACLGSVSWGAAQAQTEDATTIQDEYAVRAIDRMDSLLNEYHAKTRYATKQDTQTMNIRKFAPETVPTYPPDVYQQRLREMYTVFPMDYNKKVQAYIDLYGARKRILTSKLLGLQHVYFPIIEEVFRREGLPLELKYLAAIESALNPKAVSPMAAVGLWQIIYGTAKLYDLRVDSYVDERLDPYKSTVAAARFLKDLYFIYQDWRLVIAAYNCGPGNVNRAVRLNAGSLDFWKLSQRHLPRETADYVPAFIGCAYVMHYHKEHNLYPIYTDFTFQQETMSIVGQKIRLDKLAQQAGEDPEILLKLNPQLLQGVVPYSSQPYSIRVTSKVGLYYALDAQALARVAEPEQYAARVQKGPIKDWTISKTSKQIPRLVDLPPQPAASNEGDKPTVVNLTTVASTEHAQTEAQTPGAPHQPAPVAAAKTAPQYHRVQYGDSLWTIAQRYSGQSVEKLLRTNNLSLYSTLQVGQLIRLAN